MSKLLTLLFVFTTVAFSAEKPAKASEHQIKFSGEYYTVAQVTVPPQPEKRIAPRYPLDELRARRQGLARVAFIVNTDGFTEELHVVDATAPSFGKAALAALEQWHFMPGELNGRRVRVVMVQDVPFTLSDRR